MLAACDAVPLEAWGPPKLVEIDVGPVEALTGVAGSGVPNPELVVPLVIVVLIEAL